MTTDAAVIRAKLHRRYLAAKTAAARERIWQEILLNDKRGGA